MHQVTGSGTNVITINQQTILNLTQYYVQIDGLILHQELMPCPLMYFTSYQNPADNATKVEVDSNIELTFSEAVDMNQAVFL